MKHLQIGDQVIAIFLGSPEPCEVIEVIDKKQKLYKLRMKSGTILPGVTWFKLLDAKQQKTKPWHIVKYTGHTEVKVLEKDSIQRSDLENHIQKQKDFLGGNIKK